MIITTAVAGRGTQRTSMMTGTAAVITNRGNDIAPAQDHPESESEIIVIDKMGAGISTAVRMGETTTTMMMSAIVQDRQDGVAGRATRPTITKAPRAEKNAMSTALHAAAMTASETARGHERQQTFTTSQGRPSIPAETLPPSRAQQARLRLCQDKRTYFPHARVLQVTSRRPRHQVR